MIRVVRTSYKDIKDFNKREWAQADLEHYGQVVDWKERKIILKATEDGETLGTIKMMFQAGVAEIQTIIVTKDERRGGIGRKLMAAGEKFAKKYGCHFVYLVTGKDWQAVGFYESLGYKNLGTIPSFYHKKDFLEFYKHI